ncbi:MAG: lipoyl synthase [Acidimicrobiia bacterium]
MCAATVLSARWLGKVPYREAHILQGALHARSGADHLLLLEHPHVYTLGRTARTEHLLVPPADVGADLVHADRGGDITYHGPGQLVGYPILTLPQWRDGMTDLVAYVRRLEDALIAALADLGVEAGREDRLTGVWVGGGDGPPEKVAAIGVKVTRGRTMHGFALNVDPDLEMFSHIVPCGIRDRGVTSLRRRLGRPVAMREVVDAVTRQLAATFGYESVERQDVVWHERPSDLSAFSLRPPSALPAPEAPASRGEPVRLLGRLAQAGVAQPDEQESTRRPPWMKVRARLDGGYQELKGMMRGLDLHTVCEEAGCPNIYECWSERTATFMILGDRCTRACGFCLVDTRRPMPLDTAEPARVADAVSRMGLAHAVVTSVARDDLDDGGAAGFAATIAAIRAENPATTIEVLIPDCKGDATALDVIFDARPDVCNHNLETVARLQRAARPSAAYARSLALLARAKATGLTTKSGLILGMGETAPEVRGAISDLAGVGVDILTVGQYLRPTPMHLPVVKWWHPDEFTAIGAYARSLGFSHVESGPLVRSSYHARRAVESTSEAPSRAG